MHPHLYFMVEEDQACYHSYKQLPLDRCHKLTPPLNSIVGCRDLWFILKIPRYPNPQSILCPMLWLRYMPHTCNSYHIVTQMKYCALRNARGWPLVQMLPFLNYHRLTAASTLVKDLVFLSRWPALILIICH